MSTPVNDFGWAWMLVGWLPLAFFVASALGKRIKANNARFDVAFKKWQREARR